MPQTISKINVEKFTRTDTDVYYFLGDHLGSTSVIADSAGNEVGHALYDPFGAVITSTLPATVTDRLFTGQRWNATIGLYDYNARFYDADLGQFTQPDSLVPDPANPMAWNRYAYTYNNPLNYTDPSGHSAVGIAALAVGTVAAVDTVWDVADFAATAAACFGDNDSLACALLPVASLAVVGLVADLGPGDNAARKAYLIGGLPQDNEGIQQIVELSQKYSEVTVNDIIDYSDQLTQMFLEEAGHELPNVKYMVGDASKLPRLDYTDIFAVAPNESFHNALVTVSENVLGNQSRLVVASNLSAAADLANKLRTRGFNVSETFFKTNACVAEVGSRNIQLRSWYFRNPGRYVPIGNVNTLLIVTH